MSDDTGKYIFPKIVVAKIEVLCRANLKNVCSGKINTKGGRWWRDG